MIKPENFSVVPITAGHNIFLKIKAIKCPVNSSK